MVNKIIKTIIATLVATGLAITPINVQADSFQYLNGQVWDVQYSDGMYTIETMVATKEGSATQYEYYTYKTKDYNKFNNKLHIGADVTLKLDTNGSVYNYNDWQVVNLNVTKEGSENNG